MNNNGFDCKDCTKYKNKLTKLQKEVAMLRELQFIWCGATTAKECDACFKTFKDKGKACHERNYKTIYLFSQGNRA